MSCRPGKVTIYAPTTVVTLMMVPKAPDETTPDAAGPSTAHPGGSDAATTFADGVFLGQCDLVRGIASFPELPWPTELQERCEYAVMAVVDVAPGPLGTDGQAAGSSAGQVAMTKLYTEVAKVRDSGIVMDVQQQTLSWAMLTRSLGASLVVTCACENSSLQRACYGAG